MKLANICVYCGSSPGRRPGYAAAAEHFGQALVARGLGLVYGGGRVGLMGTIADAVLAAGGRVVGVIPQALATLEVAHRGLTELIVTESMHARKMAMAERADAFVALPGGIGTFEELFEVWTWTQLGFHDKPCGLLNVDGYFDHLVRFLDHAVGEQYLKRQHRGILAVQNEPEALLDALAAFEGAPAELKWADLKKLS